ncbi:hypothetical protein [Paraburkholderia caribensis]|uniref:hypothetical protein n=1 Tax=Paraburkholderia caribensis TaxID=75105 RepID=UPI00158FDA14|nr:hypothetical protein [Paraburkholderia caribensis]
MSRQYTFSVTDLQAQTDELVAAVHGSNDFVIISDSGAPKSTLHNLRASQSLQRAVSILERVVAERADAAGERRAEIDEVLKQLCVVH